MALLCLAEGRIDAAHASTVRRSTPWPPTVLRRRGCAPRGDIALAAGDLATARHACQELEAAAAAYGTSGLEAAALYAHGAVVLAEERPQESLPALRAACRRWNDVQAPYEVARACRLLGSAYAALDDDDAAAAELSSAGETFERLRATVDAAVVAGLQGERALPGGLTGREADVPAHVAQGGTNREVADALVLSEKTVARHLSNISYETFGPEFAGVRTSSAGAGFDEDLLPVWLQLVPGLRARLAAGACVADIGCGTGHAIVVLARAFPGLGLRGLRDLRGGDTAARREAAAHGLDNARFEVRDAATLAVDDPFDVVFVFDAIYGQVAPADALRRIHDMLASYGMPVRQRAGA